MVQYKPPQLPTAADLPDSDDTPVDNELQTLIPILLRAILALQWAERKDWFLGVNMGVYYAPDKPAIVPDGFLSLGVERFKGNQLRLSYLFWEENTIPQLVFEVVSRTPGGEYKDKMSRYAQIGILYYVIYNPDYWRRDQHDPFEVYRLVDETYIKQVGQPVWMPEVGLGIGCAQGTHEGCPREWLYWYDKAGNRLSAPEDVIDQEQQRAEAERQRAEAERQRAEAERQRAEAERQRADKAERQLEQTERQLEQERQLREELISWLRQKGIDRDGL